MITDRQAEIMIRAQGGELWRSNATGHRIYTSSETVTAAADRLLYGRQTPLLYVDRQAISWRAERTNGPLVEGHLVRPTDAGRAALAAQPGWSMLCLMHGIGHHGEQVTPDPDAIGFEQATLAERAHMSLDQLIDAGYPIPPAPGGRAAAAAQAAAAASWPPAPGTVTAAQLVDAIDPDAQLAWIDQLGASGGLGHLGEGL